MLFTWPILSPFAGALETTTFTGGEPSVDVVIESPGLKGVATIDVPNPCTPLLSLLNVSADPDRAPLSPRLDVGDDGTSEWAFDGTGYGPFGRQTMLRDTRTGFNYSVDGDFLYNAGLLLPKTASIRSAALNITGTPGDPVLSPASGGALDLKAGETASPAGPAVPAGAAGINATVRLSDARTAATDVECTAWSNFKVFGWQGVQYQSLAQTFSPSAACNLTGVELWINSIVGSPGALYIEIRATDASGKPAAALSAVKMIAQGAVTAPGWNGVAFSPPIDLAAGTKYAIVAYAKDASTSGTNEYLWYGSALDDPYSGGCLWIYAPDADASGAPFQSSLTDQAFRTIVKRPLTGPEMGQVRVNGAAPSSNDGKGGYIYDFVDPSYGASGWAFSVKNQNAFNLTSLAYSASTWYRPCVVNVSVGVNGRASDWTAAGPLKGAAVADIGAGLARELPGAEASPDAFGNLMCAVNLTFKASGAGALRLDSLDIRYDLTVQVGDFSGALAEYLAGKPAGTVPVPVAVSASSPGSVRLGALSVQVDAAPVQTAPIPSVSIPEDGQNYSLLDLSAYLVDEEGCTYECLVAESANASNVGLTVDGAMLGAWAVKADWHGTVQLAVEAKDGRGQRTVSNSFDLVVAPVNDAPVLSPIPPARAEAGKDWQYQAEASDVDGDALSFSLSGAPAGMTVNATGLLAWRPGASDLGKSFNVTLAASDGALSASQGFGVTVFSGNRPPAFGPVANVTATAGAPWSIVLPASDPDGDELLFSLVDAPAGMTVNRTGVVSWTAPKAGNHTVRARVSDGVASAEVEFVLKVAAVPPPVITSAPPAAATQGKRLSYQLAAEDRAGAGNLTYTLLSGPAGMALSAGGLLTWTPSKDQSGTFHVVVRVKAGNESAVQEFDLKVAAVSEPAKADNAALLIAAAVVAAAVVAALAAVALRRKGKGGAPG
jgi:hypothetical protein